MSKAAFYLFLPVLLLLAIVEVYYISVNTFFSDRVLPNVKIGKMDVSFKSEDEVNAVLGVNTAKAFNEFVEVQVDEFEYSVPISEMNVMVKTGDVVGYGKGADFVDVVVGGLELLDGEEIQPGLEFDLTPVIEGLPFEVGKTNAVIVSGDRVSNCESNTFDVSLNTEELEGLVEKAILGGYPVNVPLRNILEDTGDADTIVYCRKYNDELPGIEKQLNELVKGTIAENLIELVGVGSGAEWKIKDYKALDSFLLDYKVKSHKPATEGKYQIIDGKIYLTGAVSDGMVLNLDKSRQNINDWLKSPESRLVLSFDPLSPAVNNMRMEVLDFTKLLSSGKTRIDLIRNGVPNGGVYFAQAGIVEMNNEVIQAGEEFSFLDRLNLQTNGKTEEGFSVGGGICNSSTTLFRAALEAGLRVTERHQHSWFVRSYDWGYPVNIVDAAFFPRNPRMDLRFVNDFDYPILLQSSIVRSDDGYQYHTIEMYTSSKVQKRDVELTNWQKKSVYSETRFTGSFERIVRENGVELWRDSFSNTYWQDR